jgi:hypothetical protein
MLYLGLHGYRCIAHDRRGHGHDRASPGRGMTWIHTPTISRRSSKDSTSATRFASDTQQWWRSRPLYRPSRDVDEYEENQVNEQGKTQPSINHRNDLGIEKASSWEVHSSGRALIGPVLLP